MIIDSLTNLPFYSSLHSRIELVWDFLQHHRLETLANGRHEIQGSDLYVNIQELAGQAREAAKMEFHRQYIDIQIPISGLESYGWSPLAKIDIPSFFDEEKDYALLSCRPELWYDLSPGLFAIFFPHDVHAPGCGEGLLRKAVFKLGL